MKDQTFKIRITTTERTMLDELAAAREESAAFVIRELVRREHAKLTEKSSKKGARRVTR